MTKDQGKPLVAIPTYNELGSLPSLVAEIFRHLPHCEILVIDDHSPDGTGRWCDEYAQSEPRLKCIHRQGKQGLGTALVMAMHYAVEGDYPWIITMDADLSHPPHYLPELLAEINSAEKPSPDVVIGSRYTRGGAICGWSRGRRLMSAAVNLYARLLLGLHVKDCSSGYRCYRTDAVADIDWGRIRSDGFSFEEEFLWRLKQRGAHLTEIPFTFVERKKGSSKINLKEAFVAFWVIPLVAVGRLSACRRKQAADPC